MKKIIAITLAIVLTLSLCACGKTFVNTPTNDIETDEQDFIGTWMSNERFDDYHNVYHSFRLLPSGKAIWGDREYGNAKLVTETGNAMSCEWLIDEDRIIIFYIDDGESRAYILNITNNYTLEWEGFTFSRFT